MAQGLARGHEWYGVLKYQFILSRSDKPGQPTAPPTKPDRTPGAEVHCT
jgi:hypothetical protein